MAGRSAAGGAEVKRKVHFYRTRLQVDEDTEAILDPIAVRDAVQRSNTGDRYQELDDNEATCVWPESAGGRVALTIGGVRRSGLPWLEDAGNVLPLSIGDRQGLVEQTHMVFFDDGIIGAEFNFYGPRPKRLIGFLREKCPDVPPFQLDMLLNFDAAEQVKNLEDIRLIQLRVNRSGLDLFSQGDESLPASLRATADNLGGTYVELVLRPELHSKGTLGQRALDWVRGLAGDQRTKEGADVFKVRGLDRRTSQVELVDLLKDQLVSTRTVAQQDRRHRGVDARSMFSQIASAYEELYESIQRAAGIGG